VLVRDFGRRLQSSLRRWCAANEQWLAPGTSVDDLWEDESGYAVLMTLRGEGVGIWDGRWDHMFRHGSVKQAIDHLRRTLERDLGRWADASGGGVLSDAFGRDAEACSDDPSAELDEEDEALDRDLEREERELSAGLTREVNDLDRRGAKRRR
jgi:hypothetical protein